MSFQTLNSPSFSQNYFYPAGNFARNLYNKPCTTDKYQYSLYIATESDYLINCHSEQGKQKEQGINQRFCERFEAVLKNIADGLSKPRTEKRLDKVHERIGRLKEKSKGIGQHYAIELLPDASGKKAVELRWTKQPQVGTRLTPPGVYCLRSNQIDWDSERLWRTYIILTDL